ncbi:Monofunctional biosynthetic peptidoglycan transglycosylase [Magnetospirillum molischianum DSM 120]|uniref:Biosynthetic peptidoglycan transglycosylase n=2 Tax=Magnetospirillum molischianum TaxID=1083 RepID=H8FQY5_MAGML|nr:Monofunctional biosynthetic peptidoglycan transglycosylase [Magnetospirillum molischianum DSM 120]
MGGLGLLIGIPLTLTMLFRVVPPPVTPLMLLRVVQGYGIDKNWRPLDQISPYLRQAVIASEDAKFCTHWGFDWDAIDNAIDMYEDGGKVLGASTISMQTAKNVFLWPGRTFVRKGMEAYLTLYLEGLWPKRRILEVYLNVAEFGPGLYGAEAAAMRYFGKPAATLSPREAALLAAVLPAPLKRSPSRPSAAVSRRAGLIAARAAQVRLGRDGAC